MIAMVGSCEELVGFARAEGDEVWERVETISYGSTGCCRRIVEVFLVSTVEWDLEYRMCLGIEVILALNPRFRILFLNITSEIGDME
jgi:hypothetical protein